MTWTDLYHVDLVLVAIATLIYIFVFLMSRRGNV